MLPKRFKDIDKTEFAMRWETAPSVTVLARDYGVNPRSVQQWAANLELPSRGAGAAQQERAGSAIAFPENAGPDYTDAIRIEEDRVCVIGDVELPDHSISGLEMVVSIARKFGLKTLVINGDFCSYDSFSGWARQQVKSVFFKQEIDAVMISLQVFLQTFDKIYYISGNHERRLPHTVDGEITVGMFLGQLAGVEFSEYSHLDLKSGDKEWLICHQKNFSIVPLSVPAKLCVARQKNILCAHNHRLALGRDPSGKYYLVEGGHLRDEKKTHYKQLRVTTHPMWNIGFSFIVNGIPFLVDKENVDFWLSVTPPNTEKTLKNGNGKPNRARAAR